MSTSAHRLTRLLALVPYLRHHPGARLADVAAEFGVPAARLRQDLELLWVCGLPGGAPGDLLDFAFEGDRVTVLDPQTLDRPLRLSADEALALTVAARALADVPGLAERDALERARAKLEAVAAAPARPPVAVDLDPETAQSTLAGARTAVEQRRRAFLRYHVESRDEVTEREVDPMRLTSRDGHWYLEAWCRRVEAVRLFRLDRVVSLEVLDHAAELPPDAVPRDLADGLFAPSPDDAAVVLDLALSARWVADYYPVESAEERPDGALRVVLRTPDPGWVVRLALRLGGAGRVVAPAGLVDEVRLRARRALDRTEMVGEGEPAGGRRARK